MIRLNNWMQYSYDDGPLLGPKTSKNSIFKLHFAKKIEGKNLNYYDALLHNGRMVAENFTGPFDVMLSGGIDSEVVVRINKQLGIKQNIYTFRLENDYNIRDVESAQSICRDLGIKLNIIDWNLQKWIENDAYEVYQRTFSPIIERMVRFDWFKYLDNIIVMGEGEPYWKRELSPNYSIEENVGTSPNYSVKSKWHLHWVEDYFMSSTYANLIGQTVIGEWYNYTPEVVKSFHKLPLIQKLLSDKIVGKASSWSSRTKIHQTLFPNISQKLKLVGYEGRTGLPCAKPEFMKRFQQEVIGDTTNQGYKFTTRQIDKLLK